MTLVRSFFSRVFLSSAAVLVAMLAVGGLLLDNFLAKSEINRLGDQVERFALILKDEVTRAKDEAELQPLVKRLEGATRVRFTIVAGDGRVIADSLLDPKTMENHATHPEVGEALAGRVGRNLRRSASLGIEMLYVAIPGEQVVRAALPVQEVQAVIREVQTRILLASLPAALLALLTAWLFAKSITRRVGLMREFSHRLELGDYGGNLRAEGDDELSDMERSLVALRNEIRSKVDILRRDSEVLSGLVEGFPHAVLLFDGSRNLALANAPARILFRTGENDFTGKPIGEIVRNPSILEAVDALARGKRNLEPFTLAWPDPQRQFEVVAHALPGQSHPFDYLVILRDVTREAHLERVRSDFIVNLSHELRTPLTAIRGSAETLLGAGASDPAAASKFLETIRRNSLRLEALLRDVSELARAESGAEPVHLVRLDARTPLRHSAELFAGEAEKARITLEIAIPEKPLFIESEEEKLEQALINLLQNALRYTHEGGRVRASLHEEGGKAVFTVSDTGIGIPEADIPRVTERFYRVDPGRSRAAGGTGLGLSIVKHLVERLGGELEIRSEVGKGTTVRIRLKAGPTGGCAVTPPKAS